MEEPISGLAVLAALTALVVVAKYFLSPLIRPLTRTSRPLAPILQSLRDLDDEELLAIGRRLGRLPSRDRRVRAAAQPLAAALLDWRSTFDEASRREFIDLATSLVSGYDRSQRSA